jgi:hypothetical protein
LRSFLNTSFPSGLAGRVGASVAGSWDRLAASAVTQPPMFDPQLAAGLPLPARRWLVHAIAPGTPLSQTAVLKMEGQFRLGRWLPMRATEVLSPPSGLVWVARIGWGPLSFRGFDRFESSHGEMQWHLLGRIPVVHGQGADIDRSAAGRLVGEAVWTPAAFLGPEVTWRARDDSTATAVWAVGSHQVSVDLRVGATGQLEFVTVHRWGNPDRRGWREIPFGGAVEDDQTFGGMTIPSRMSVGWFCGTGQAAQGEFFRVHVTSAGFQ